MPPGAARGAGQLRTSAGAFLSTRVPWHSRVSTRFPARRKRERRGEHGDIIEAGGHLLRGAKADGFASDRLFTERNDLNDAPRVADPDT